LEIAEKNSKRGDELWGALADAPQEEARGGDRARNHGVYFISSDFSISSNLYRISPCVTLLT